MNETPPPRAARVASNPAGHEDYTMPVLRVSSFALNGDRYHYDFKRCRQSDGWAQLDTKQDASYYGNWVNPITRELMSYCEGDITHTTCDTDEDFVAEFRRVYDWHAERGYNPRVDPGLGQSGQAIIDRFKQIKIEDTLHPAYLEEPIA